MSFDLWDLLAEIDFFCFKSFFDTLLVQKSWVPFFQPKLGYFWSPFLNKNNTEQKKNGNRAS